MNVFHSQETTRGSRRQLRWVRAAFAVLMVVALGAAASARADTPTEVALPETAAATAGVVAQELDAAEDPEFIELAIHMESLIGGGIMEPLEECDVPESGVLLCEFVKGGVHTSTLLGRSINSGTGTRRFTLTESCEFGDGLTGFRMWQEGEGTLTTARGDEFYYRNTADSCVDADGGGEGIGFIVAFGGTGRFQDATGTLSINNPVGFGNVVVGTLRVRAALWEDLMPSMAATISPGIVGLDEGDNGQVVVEVPVALSLPWAETVTVDWATSDTGETGIATEGIDYVAAAGTVTFAPGETEKTVSISVIGDTDVEPPLLYGEWGLVQFSNPSPNAEIDMGLGGNGVFVIIDDD